MNQDFDLLEQFDPPKARHTDPVTSHKAALKQRINCKVGSIRHAILSVVGKTGMYGSASFEVAEALGVERDIVSSHFRPLERMGFLELTKMRRINRKSSSKNECMVWITTQKYQDSDLARKPVDIKKFARKCPHCGGSL